MDALELLDSRRFTNMMDGLVAVWAKKRSTDSDKAQMLQPVLDYLDGQGINSSRTATEEKAYQARQVATPAEEAAYLAKQAKAMSVDSVDGPLKPHEIIHAPNPFETEQDQARKIEEMLGIIDEKGKASSEGKFTCLFDPGRLYPIQELAVHLEGSRLPYSLIQNKGMSIPAEGDKYSAQGARAWVVEFGKK